MRIDISSDMLRWAQERSQLDLDELRLRFSKLPDWESGKTKPTLKQLEKFAKAVHVPIGVLFLPEPPEERIPIPDLRTIDNQQVRKASPNLLEMIFHCQERQSWYRDYARISNQEQLGLIGSADLSMPTAQVASNIRNQLGFNMDVRAECRTWEDALRLFIQLADQAGIMVMVSGVVLSNNNRKLDTREFRGFALADPLAPLVFINGTDSKSGQMFTLAHELAHLWLNTSGLSNVSGQSMDGFPREEIWCNAVAAELLVPMANLQPLLIKGEDVQRAKARLTKHFKVSGLVILRRLLDANWFTREEFEQAWRDEKTLLNEIAERTGSGGDFYRTTVSRVSRRFTQALIISTMEGQTLYRDAFRMLGVAKTTTFNNLGREVGVML